jgi:hypothetical protein
MEADAIVEAGLGEVQEVLCGHRGGLVEEADDDVAQVGREANAGAVSGGHLEGDRVRGGGGWPERQVLRLDGDRRGHGGEGQGERGHRPNA